MIINSDINVLGSLPDWSLVRLFQVEESEKPKVNQHISAYTNIKTDKSVKRFEKAITGTLLKSRNEDVKQLLQKVLNEEGITSDGLFFLFWNASLNNDLLHYLNLQVFFPAFFSGRVSIRTEEAEACLRDLRENEPELKKWSESTLKTSASKYLTLLKKFQLMQGSLHKTINHPYLSDKMFILFIYWLKAVESTPNLLESQWLAYSFSEKNHLIERLMQKKFARFFQLSFTGDKLKIETEIPYSSVYHAIQ
jgi:hypothetical protein